MQIERAGTAVPAEAPTTSETSAVVREVKGTPQKQSFDESVAAIAKLQGRSGELENRKLSERELYAALIHQQLKEHKPALAAKYLSRLGQELRSKEDTRTKSDLFKAADRVMRAFVRDGSVSQELYRATRDFAFGRSQLDDTADRLDTRKMGGINQATYGFFKGASADPLTIDSFKREEARAGRAAREKKGESVSVGNSIPNEGFLWKPLSDSDGKLVVLLPSSLNGDVESVTLRSSSGALIEEGRYSGLGNGDRQHYRFKQAGSSYPSPLTLEVLLESGKKLHMTIKDPSHRKG